jgi:hypothetical protein
MVPAAYTAHRYTAKLAEKGARSRPIRLTAGAKKQGGAGGGVVDVLPKGAATKQSAPSTEKSKPGSSSGGE